MATPSQRRIHFKEIRKFGSQSADYPVPDLTVLQTMKYRAFLQEEAEPKNRADQGLESVLREIFPIESYDKTTRLEYLYYELEKPRYEPDECRQLRLTYGRPFKVRLRLVRENESVEEDVYLGDLPIMLGGGEFIINGAERVVVSQLHRSPGIDFVTELDAERKTFNCRIIPERGSWIELHISRKETIAVRIDQSSKLPVMMLLRAMSPEFSSNAQILRTFYPTMIVRVDSGAAVSKIDGKITVEDVVYPQGSDRAGEIIVESGQPINKTKAEAICSAGLKKIEIMDEQRNKLLLNSLEEDKTKSHEDALLRIYQRLRPGNPPQLDKARELFREKFYDLNRYRLGRVGRFRINRKLYMDINESNIDELSTHLQSFSKADAVKLKQGSDQMLLLPIDIVQAISYLCRLWGGERKVTADVYSPRYKEHIQKQYRAGELPEFGIDDIDHLGNRRLRTIDELASEELRKGFLKLRRTVQERMSLRGNEVTPRQVINQKSISAAIEYFFGRGELSQVVDQTNPLSMLTHERRLSALGPGGLNRKRAGFDVRDVHSSHYGRICPIETPEGTNIGLISSLAIYAGVDEFGFLIAPYRKVKDGKITNHIDWLRADEEHEVRVAPADVPIKDGKIQEDPIAHSVIVRYRGDYDPVSVEEVEYVDVAPSQMVGVSAGLIPFLEHDDANRALMGSNMQRQAVPLLISEPPLVATGLEEKAGFNSSLLVHARQDGVVTYVDSQRVIIDHEDEYVLRKFVGLNERTCQNQTPIVQVGEKVAKGQIIADGASMYRGELSLGRNVLVAFMAWDGFNFEDAIIISEELVQKDTYTSIHIEEFDVEIRDTKLGREEFTRDIPNVGEKALRHLDNGGIIKVGTYVRPGDILVGKVTPKSKTELTPEEKLLHAIFGRAGEDVKNESLEVPSGIEGIVIGTQKFCCRMSLSEDERKAFDEELRTIEKEGNHRIAEAFGEMIIEMEKVLGYTITDEDGNALVHDADYKFIAEQAMLFRPGHLRLDEDEQTIDLSKQIASAGEKIKGVDAKINEYRAKMTELEEKIGELEEGDGERIRFEKELGKLEKDRVKFEKDRAKFEKDKAKYEKNRAKAEEEANDPDNKRTSKGAAERAEMLEKIEAVYRARKRFVEAAIDSRDRKLNSMKRGDELRRGVLQSVKVYIAAKRVISVGDKMAGRHGNKGVIAKILPKEDMPFLADGTPVQIMLNPLGVPSRMNVGQILETHLGWAAAKLGYQAMTPVFNGGSEEDINKCLEEAGLPSHGKVRLFDGRTGEPFDQETTVGYIYMLKLHHLVDDKVHARSTGPYSLITQQPLGGKARFGGQRFGEMEVWALEAYGAAYTLQELLTVKSDDVEGRTKIYESMVKGENTLEAGTPASFDVLTNEIRGLALNMELLGKSTSGENVRL
ncbi:MAG TPA: DNA-directed RNA polymerase subunit beta [Planctomycetaceae bacterium]|nr:DNA-directed RNA polymerase subunit beta [Planctomycetaceae bacterium]